MTHTDQILREKIAHLIEADAFRKYGPDTIRKILALYGPTGSWYVLWTMSLGPEFERIQTAYERADAILEFVTRTPDTAPSQSAELIAEAEAEKIHDALIQLSMGDMSTYEAEGAITRVIATALRAAEARIASQSDLIGRLVEENARLREALRRIAGSGGLFAEPASGQHAREIARRALGSENNDR